MAKNKKRTAEQKEADEFVISRAEAYKEERQANKDIEKYTQQLDSIIDSLFKLSTASDRYKDKIASLTDEIEQLENRTTALTQAEEDDLKEKKKKLKRNESQLRNTEKQIEKENYRKDQASRRVMVAEQRRQSAEKNSDKFSKKEFDRLIAELKKTDKNVTKRSYSEAIAARDKEKEKERRKGGESQFKSSLRQKGGGNLAVGVLNGIAEIASGIGDIWIAQQKKSLNVWMANQDIYLKTLETGGKIFQRHMKTFGKGMGDAMTSTFSSITQGVQEGAYAAASGSLSYASQSLTNVYEDELDRLKMYNYKALTLRKTQLENFKLEMQQYNSAASMVNGVASMFGPVGSAIGGLITSGVQTATKMAEATREIDFMKYQKQLEISEKQQEQLTEAQKSAVEVAEQHTSKILEFTKSIEQLTLKTDEAAKSMANVVGAGHVADDYEKFIFSAIRNMKFTGNNGQTMYLNKKAEDMMKVQTAYIESSTRNGMMSANDLIKSFLLGETFGDDNLAATLLGDMDYFNKSIENGTDLIFDMFQMANKAGVSNRKFAKDLQQNLKLAQKYTFKGGVKAMMEMSIWAQKTRFNMQNLESIVDSIQDGGLENVITKGAKLQVLGGDMAMRADPIAMMFEAWADPEALMKRFSDMTKGIGHFNRETGEVDIYGPDAMRLKAYAEASGMNYADARAQITQRIKGEQIDRQLTKNYTDEQKALIYNKAKLENGEWKVNVYDPRTKEVTSKGINDLSGTDWNSLMPTEQSIENYVSGIYNILNQQGGVTGYLNGVLQDETFENTVDNMKERAKDNLDFINGSTDGFGKNVDVLKGIIEEGSNFVTQQNKIEHENMIKTSDILKQEFEIMIGATKMFTKTMSDGSSELRKALDAVQADVAWRINPNDATADARSKAFDALGKGILDEANLNLDDVGKKEVSQKDLSNARDMLEWFYDESNSENINETLQLLANAWSPNSEIDTDTLDYILSNGYDDLLDAFEKVFKAKGYSGVDDDIKNWKSNNELTKDLVPALISMAYRDYMYGGTGSQILDQSTVKALENSKRLIKDNGYYEDKKVNDAIVSGRGKSMLLSASDVTPINDGLVQTNPNDVGVFIRKGGAMGNLIGEMIDYMHSGGGTVHFDTLRIDGKIELVSNGHSIDIMSEINKDPMIKRQLAREIVSQFTSSKNGGKGLLPIGVSNTING